MSSKTAMLSWVGVALVSGCSGGPSDPPTVSQDVVSKGLQLAFQANVHGDIEPCG